MMRDAIVVAVRIDDLVNSLIKHWATGYIFHAIEKIGGEVGVNPRPGDPSRDEYIDDLLRLILKAKKRKDGTIKIPRA